MTDGPTDAVHSAQCSSCSAPIYFVKTLKGRAMPLDITPATAGNVLVIRNRAFVFSGPDAAEHAYPGRDRYMPHHATCPTVDQHR